MRERKMFFPPALRLAAVAIALSAAALALPLPVFAVLDRAAGHSIAPRSKQTVVLPTLTIPARANMFLHPMRTMSPSP